VRNDGASRPASAGGGLPFGANAFQPKSFSARRLPPPSAGAQDTIQPVRDTPRPTDASRIARASRPSAVINVLLNAPNASRNLPGSQRQREKSASRDGSLSMGQIQSFLASQGVQARRARINTPSGSAEGLICTAPGRNVGLVLGRLSELGISHDGSLDQGSLDSAEARERLQGSPDRKGIAFLGQVPSDGSDDQASTPFTFHINVATIRSGD
jgi:hypothetical protein